MFGHFRILDRYLSFLLRPAALAVLAVAYFVLIRYLDTRWRFLPYVIGATLVIAALAFLLSRRPVFSLYIAGVLVLLQSAASAVKFELKGYSLHIYDFIFVGADGSALGFLLKYYTAIFVVAIAALVAAALLLWRIHFLEKPWRVPAYLRIGPLFASLALAVAAHPAPRPGDPPFVFGFNVSSLFLSLWHVPDLAKRLPLAETLDTVAIEQPFRDRVDCDAGGRKPDIFLVLSESQTSPLLFPELRVPANVSQKFESGDGKIRSLFVETFGGGTWMTNFSVLTGLSSADFQWQAPYVNQLMENKIKGALPEVLARCGYRTVTIMPMKYQALNEGPFLKSLGFQEVYDADAMGLGELETRDRVYFDFAERIVAEHRRQHDSRPLFIALQTIFPHAPYERQLVPASDAPARDYGLGRDVNEYMRRVEATRTDFATFLDTVRRSPGPDGTVVVEFGDHQSVATKELASRQYSGDNIFADYRSKVYETYYGIHGFGTDIDYSQLDHGEDAPFLMSRVIAAAGLPTSPVFEDLRRLSDVCQGRFHTCDQRADIDAHLKKRVEAGLLVLD